MGVSLEPLLWCIKYRPMSWTDFVGQDQAINELKDLADSNTLTNMIFYGPTGTGKTAAADIFSRAILGSSYTANFKSLNIRDMWDMSMSDAKRSVQDLAKLSRDKRTELDEYMSIIYREAQTNLKIKGIKNTPNRSQLLQEAIRFFASTVTVADEKVKILVLDEADALSQSMQQALRRTMELYSDACRFILLTPSLSGWSPAVISRCSVIKFPSISNEHIITRIQYIAQREGVKIDNHAAEAIAHESSGDMRRAINLFQISATASKTITEDVVYRYSDTPLTKRVREIVTDALDGSFVDSRKIMMSLLAIDGYEPQDILLEIERDLVTRPFDASTLSKVLDRVAEIDFRLLQGKNPFVHLSSLLASLGTYAPESN